MDKARAGYYPDPLGYYPERYVAAYPDQRPPQDPGYLVSSPQRLPGPVPDFAREYPVSDPYYPDRGPAPGGMMLPPARGYRVPQKVLQPPGSMPPPPPMDLPYDAYYRERSIAPAGIDPHGSQYYILGSRTGAPDGTVPLPPTDPAGQRPRQPVRYVYVPTSSSAQVGRGAAPADWFPADDYYLQGPGPGPLPPGSYPATPNARVAPKMAAYDRRPYDPSMQRDYMGPLPARYWDDRTGSSPQIQAEIVDKLGAMRVVDDGQLSRGVVYVSSKDAGLWRPAGKISADDCKKCSRK